MATKIYRDNIEWAYKNLSATAASLQRKVWDGTPWMVNAYTGSTGDSRDSEMREWCEVELGVEAWPIHGRQGVWQRGGATINGWTWFGFASEEMMERFLEAWPAPSDAEEF